MRQSLFSDVDISSREAEREQAQIHDDQTFLGEVIEAIDRDFSLPDLKYTLSPVLPSNSVLHYDVFQGSHQSFSR
jgi:hypothetical protein